MTDRISGRLVTIAELLSDCNINTVADVGCDHGYVPIYLIQHGIAKRAIAMDVRQGPLSGARQNIEECGLADDIKMRLSDGLTELKEGEADGLIIAGMGGKLMMEILDKRDIAGLGIKKAVLQPQSDIPLLRSFIRQKGFAIVDEKMVYEDGKYYFPMLTDTAGNGSVLDEAVKKICEIPINNIGRTDAERICNRFGEHNLLKNQELLGQYLAHGAEVCESILKGLDENIHPERFKEVSVELSDIRVAMKFISN